MALAHFARSASRHAVRRLEYPRLSTIHAASKARTAAFSKPAFLGKLFLERHRPGLSPCRRMIPADAVPATCRLQGCGQLDAAGCQALGATSCGDAGGKARRNPPA